MSRSSHPLQWEIFIEASSVRILHWWDHLAKMLTKKHGEHDFNSFQNNWTPLLISICSPICSSVCSIFTEESFAIKRIFTKDSLVQFVVQTLFQSVTIRSAWPNKGDCRLIGGRLIICQQFRRKRSMRTPYWGELFALIVKNSSDEFAVKPSDVWSSDQWSHWNFFSVSKLWFNTPALSHS